MVEALLESGGQEVAVADNGQSRAGTPTEYSSQIGQITLDNMNLTSIQKFYSGQSIFITGGTGFLGKLLIEKLLRSCPGIANIYLLVRPKKGKTPYERTEELFDDPLFERLKVATPKFRHQIVGIEGDCSIPGLGISEIDRKTLINEVSIVFHVAATVRFDEKIKLAVAINIQSVRDIITMCKNMPKLKSFVHVSTAYAYCTQNPIEEKFYESPMDADNLITMLQCTDENLADVITPHILGKWPNTYAFTKAVAESVVQKEGCGMPIGVFRPAIVISTYQEPVRGWIDNMYGPTGVAAGAGTGLLRTLHCDGSMQANVVPGDMVVNALIASAWDIAEIKRTNPRSSEIPVYNYVSKDNPITFDDLKDLSAKYGLEYPSSKAIWYYSFRNNKHKFVHLIYVYLFHLLPALIIDGATICIGKQPRLLKVYKKVHRFMEVLNYFSTKKWDFTNDRMNNVHDKLSLEDRDKFFFDMKSLVWETYFQTYIQGIRIYLIKDPPETLPMARVKWQRMYWIHQAFKLLLAYVFLRISWAIFSVIISNVA